MKKLLSLLGVLSLSIIAAVQVSACSNNTNTPPSITQQATIYVDENGVKHTTYDHDLSQRNATEILQIGFYKDDKDNLIKVVRMPYKVQKAPTTLLKEITSLTYMFNGARSFNGDISNWDVSKVTDMSWMFNQSQFNGDISGWNTSKVTTMSYMFSQSKFNKDISGWDVSNVKDMSDMFWQNPNFNQNILPWKTNNVTNMDDMFNSATAFNQNLSGWNVSKVTSHTNFNANSALDPLNLPNWVS